jgi:hypothetical protein
MKDIIRRFGKSDLKYDGLGDGMKIQYEDKIYSYLSRKSTLNKFWGQMFDRRIAVRAI